MGPRTSKDADPNQKNIYDIEEIESLVDKFNKLGFIAAHEIDLKNEKTVTHLEKK